VFVVLGQHGAGVGEAEGNRLEQYRIRETSMLAGRMTVDGALAR
jgi:hypothetical protein